MLDTSNELVAHILLGVLSYFTELEAKKISERIKARPARVQAQGKKLRRPTKFDRYREILAEMKEQGYSKVQMAKKTGLAHDTMKKYLRQMKAEAA